MATSQRVPIGDVLAQWSRSAGAVNYPLVDDPTPDDDATYTYTPTQTHMDLFDCTAFAIPSGSLITNVKVYGRFKRMEAGGDYIVRELVRVNGVTYIGSPQDLPMGYPTPYVDRSYTWATNPNTGQPWTVDDVNGVGSNPLQTFGYECIGFQKTVRCTQVYIEVNYVSYVLLGSSPTVQCERYLVGHDAQAFIYGDNWESQTFTVGAIGPNLASELTSVKVRAFRYGDPPILFAVIKAVDGEGKPTGPDLSTGSVDPSGWTTNEVGNWYEISMSAYVFEPNTTYALLLKSPGSDAYNDVYWRYDDTGTYVGGEVVYSLDGGLTWVIATGDDYMFEIWGKVTTLVCSSSVSGSLDTPRKLVGLVEAQSWVSSPPLITVHLTVIREIVGAVTATCAVSGSLHTTKELVGVVTGYSTTTGVLTATTFITGTIATSSVVSGSIKVTRELITSITCQSVVSGRILIAAEVTGVATFQSTISGSMKVARRLFGSITTQSTVGGQTEHTLGLVGIVTLNSDASGTIKVTRELVTAITGQCTVVGDLTVSVLLVGVTITAQSAVWCTYHLLCEKEIVGIIIAAQSTIDGSVKRAKSLLGVIDISSTVSANLMMEVWVVSTIAAVSTVNGSLLLEVELKANVAGWSEIGGQINITRELAGSITCSSSISGTTIFYVARFVIARVVILPVLEHHVVVWPFIEHEVVVLPQLEHSVTISPFLGATMDISPFFTHATRVNEELKLSRMLT